jgi:hypothetical protein
MQSGCEVWIEHDAGTNAYYPDDLFVAAGAKIAYDRIELLNGAQIVLCVQPPTVSEVDQLAEGTIVIGFMNVTRNLEVVAKMRDRKVTAFALELVPRITRAQSMDALTSQATVSGYIAAILGAENCPKFLPMLTTAAGTIRPATVLILGAGVAAVRLVFEKGGRFDLYPWTVTIALGSVFYILFSTMLTINGLLRGAGDTLIPMFISLFSLSGTDKVIVAMFLSSMIIYIMCKQSIYLNLLLWHHLFQMPILHKAACGIGMQALHAESSSIIILGKSSLLERS